MPVRKASAQPQKSHRILSLKVTGGFLNGLHMEFAPGLNCIIGARGTGKTTTLEFLRYALFGADNEQDPQSSKRLAELVNRNLGTGEIDVAIETKDGARYGVSRSADGDSITVDADGSPVEVSFRSSLFNADIFSQNEVEGIADDRASQLHLIDKFEYESIRELNSKIRKQLSELEVNASSIRPLSEQADELGDQLVGLKAVKEQLKALKAQSSGDSALLDKAQEARSLRDREQRGVNSSSHALKSYRIDLSKFKGRLQHAIGPALSADVLKGPNGSKLKIIAEDLRLVSSQLDEQLAEMDRLLNESETKLTMRGAQLSAVHKEQELEFRTLFEKYQVEQGAAADRLRLEKQHNELLAQQQQLQEIRAQLTELETGRAALLEDLSNLRDQRFQLRKQVVDHINSMLMPTIRVKIEQAGNTEIYRSKIYEVLRDKFRSPQVATKIAQSLPPADLAAAVRTKDVEQLRERAGLVKEQAEKLISALSSPEFLMKLETLGIADLPCIELQHGDEYKPSHALSTGQKCTTILPILLLESANPLLVDQPEDNLDNSFIFETIVEKLRHIKTKRQLIFITHNPNIPVLGDADRVFVMEFDGQAGKLAKVGNVDECKSPIVTLLEGGKQAFLKRRERYNF